jgi:uncharacterized protein (TIRG00374 family)
VEVASGPRISSARGWAVALRAAIGLCLGGILLVAFLHLVNVSAVLARLEHLNVVLALLCAVPFLGAYAVRAMRWRCLLRPYEVSIPRAVAIYQVATFMNWLLPIRGGELAKPLLLRRTDGIPVSRSLATVSMDKAMDLLPAVALLALLPFLGLHLGRVLWVLLLLALAAVALAGVALALVTWKTELAVSVLTRPLAKLLPGSAGQRVEPFISQFVDTLLALVRKPRVMCAAAAYTAVAVVLDALFCLLAFGAVGVSVTLPVVLFGYTFFNLAFILPTPPGQVGSNELVGLLLFTGVFGVDSTGVGAMFLFSHPWTAALMTVTGVVCLSAMGLTLRRTLRVAAAAAEEVHA